MRYASILWERGRLPENTACTKTQRQLADGQTEADWKLGFAAEVTQSSASVLADSRTLGKGVNAAARRLRSITLNSRRLDDSTARSRSGSTLRSRRLRSLR